MNSDDDILLEVTVPENVSPKSIITVQSPDGRFFEIVLPDSVEPGNVITVIVPSPTIHDQNNSKNASTFNGEDVTALDRNNTTHNSVPNYRKAAALTAGAVVGTLIMGPIVTGVVVMGALVASGIRHSSTIEDNNFLSRISARAHALDEKNEISKTAKCVGHQTYNAVVEVDKAFGVSTVTSHLIVTAREIDEQNHISETVANIVHSGVERTREFDREHHVTEQVATVSAQAVQAAKELDSKYEVTRTLSSVFSYGTSSLSTLFGTSAPSHANSAVASGSGDSSLGHSDEW